MVCGAEIITLETQLSVSRRRRYLEELPPGVRVLDASQAHHELAANPDFPLCSALLLVELALLQVLQTGYPLPVSPSPSWSAWFAYLRELVRYTEDSPMDRIP